jgi:hypothetical protein
MGNDEVAENVATETGRWDRVRADFEGDGVTEAGICRRYGITHDELWLRAAKNKWKREHRLNGLDRVILIRQMFGLLETHIVKLETTEMTEVGDKETAVLGKLVSTLDKLIEIEGRAGAKTGPEDAKEMRDIRNKLARRIDRLKQA